jgi:hypothetical protein
MKRITAAGRYILIVASLSLTPLLLPAQDAQRPNTQLGFEELLERLTQRSRKYREFALGFSCQESLVKTSYNAERGSFRRRDREVYDYLLTTNEETEKLVEIRELIEENGKKVRRSERELHLQIPPAYAWSQLFSANNRGRFLFRPAGQLIKGYRLLIQIDFAGSAAAPGEDDIAGWSGRVSVDSETLNLHSVEAIPTGQEARIEAERIKFQRAFAIMGVPLASRPKSRTMSLTFAFLHQGLTYPAVASIHKSVYVSTADQGLERKTVMRYRSYRFFKIGTQEEDVRDEPAAALPDTSINPPDPNSAG